MKDTQSEERAENQSQEKEKGGFMSLIMIIERLFLTRTRQEHLAVISLKVKSVTPRCVNKNWI